MLVAGRCTGGGHFRGGPLLAPWLPGGLLPSGLERVWPAEAWSEYVLEFTAAGRRRENGFGASTLYQVCAQDTAPRNELDSPVGLVDVVLWGAKRTGQEAQPFGRRRLRNAIFCLKGKLRSLLDPTFRLAKKSG